MSNKYLRFAAYATMALLLIFVVGCSDDDDTNPAGPSSDWTSVNFADFDQIIEEIAPAVYEAPLLAPSDWTTGEVPLLGKVLGDNEPMSLYTNLDNFTEMVAELEDIVLMNDEGLFMLDTTLCDGEFCVEDYVQFTELNAPTAMPAALQDLLGASLDLDYLVDMDWPEMANGDIMQVAFKADDQVQTMFVFDVRAETDLITCSSVYYASLTLADSSIVMKGMTFKDYGNGFTASWLYDISSVDESDFAYKMSWFSDESEDFTLLGCIIGGGQADTEFALKYREYSPADSTDYYAEHSLEQVFNSDYSAGTGLISAYSNYLTEANFFLYDDMPTALLTSPWAVTQ